MTPGENSAIDEMMVFYRGKRSPIRQYIKGKPHPWGFKIWSRAGVDGILYDIDVYQGGSGKRSGFGQGTDVVLKLTCTLPSGKNYKVFAENLFTSVPLLKKLQERSIHYKGTIRQNRLPGCTLADEKSLKKSGRGSYDHKAEENHNNSSCKMVRQQISHATINRNSSGTSWGSSVLGQQTEKTSCCINIQDY